MESNAVEEHDDDLPDSIDQTIDWDELYDTINTFTTFEQLQQYVENCEVTTFPSLMKPILNAQRTQSRSSCKVVNAPRCTKGIGSNKYNRQWEFLCLSRKYCFV